MSKTKLYFALLGLIFLSTDARCFSAEHFVGRIVSAPGAFFFEVQQDMENISPVAVGKRFSVNTCVFPVLAPAGIVNFSAKIKFRSEGNFRTYIPQIDFFGGYWNMIWTKAVEEKSSDIADTDFSGYYFGVLATATISPKTRLFGGFKHSRLNADFELTETKEILGALVDSFDSGFADNFVVAGIEQVKGASRQFIAQIGYGKKTKTISAKFSWRGRYFELGLNIYPEGVLVVHPTLSFHIDL